MDPEGYTGASTMYRDKVINFNVSQFRWVPYCQASANLSRFVGKLSLSRLRFTTLSGE